MAQATRWHAVVGTCACSVAVVAGAQPLPPHLTARIEMRARVDAPSGAVTLGEMADMTTRDPEMLRRLMAIPLGSSPRLGEAVTVDRATVRDWVLARTGLDRADGPAIEWGGASQTVVQSASQQLSGERIAKAARTTLLQWLAERSARANVEVASTVRDLVLPPGAVTLRVRAPAPDAAPTRRMQVWVEAWVGGNYVRSAAVSFGVEAWGAANMAKGVLDKGVALPTTKAGDTWERREVDLARWGRRDIGGRLDDVVQATGGPTGVRMRRAVPSGQPIGANDIEPMPAVARGQSAVLDVRSGEILVQSQVEVLQDGRVGDLVRVRSRSADQPLMARVVAPGQLQVGP